MYNPWFAWLDRCDENDARLAVSKRRLFPFDLGAHLAFPGAGEVTNIEEFCTLAQQAVNDPDFFTEPGAPHVGLQETDGWIRIPSGIPTETEENNTAWARITRSGSRDHVLVAFHHWGAEQRYTKFAKHLVKRGITIVEVALPYHFERSPSWHPHADMFVSPNLGRTIRSIRQGVWDGRRIIRWLEDEGYEKISVLGISLGGWVAGFLTAHEPVVRKAAFFVTAGSAADVVWTGRTSQTIREGIEAGGIGLNELRRAWEPINVETCAAKLARPDLDIHFVLGMRDRVVLPELTERYIGKLKDAGANPSVMRLNCGHASLSRVPYSILSGVGFLRFLQRES